MKNTIKSFLFAAVTILTFSANAQTSKKVDATKSSIHWIGKKVTGQHDGTVNLKDGILMFKGDKLAGGKFTVDMASISTKDLEGEWAGKLDGHLKSDDFFSTEKHPNANLEFKKIAEKGNGVYTVFADLTIKGITNPVSFDMTVNGNSATSKLIINRTKYDIKYKSGSFFENLGDKTIYDDFELDVNLVF